MEVAAAVLALLHLHVPPYLFSTTVMGKALGLQLVALAWDTEDSLEAGPSCDLTQGTLLPSQSEAHRGCTRLLHGAQEVSENHNNNKI